MSKSSLNSNRFWRGLLLGLSTRGNASINTHDNAHHRAFRPVAEAFMTMQKAGSSNPDFPRHIYCSPITHHFPELDAGLIGLMQAGLADLSRRDGVIHICPKTAQRILSDPKFYTPFEQTVFSELAGRFKKYHRGPTP